MNMTSMKVALKKMTFPLLVGGLVWFCGQANAQDIINISSDQKNTTITAAGQYVDVKFRLLGRFGLLNDGSGTTALYPQVRLVVNGSAVWAKLTTWSATLNGSVYKTDVNFRYTVLPGDMAAPVRLYGVSGSGSSSGSPYQFYWNGWNVVNLDTTNNTAAVWQVNTSSVESGFLTTAEYLNFGAQNIVLKTLAFDENNSDTSIRATETTTWHVTTTDPTQSAVPLHVFTLATNVVQIGTVAGQMDLALTMPTNTTDISFAVKGLAIGTADIYVMRQQDYASITNYSMLTNYIKRTISITAPPEPTVSVVMSDTGTALTTLNETSVLNTGRFTLQLSETFTNDVWVRMDTLPVGQTYVSFNTSPYYVRIPAGSTASSEQKFNVPDGNVTSMWGVTLSPYVTNLDARAYFTGLESGTIYVQNVAPTITTPKSTDTYTATRGLPYTFTWLTSDVAADMASGMTLTWNFNGETTTNVTGASGSIAYTFTSTGTKTVKVKATDKDGDTSSEVSFTVTVASPSPKPSVKVNTSALQYNETTTNSTGSLTVSLSESYSDDVYVLLNATIQGASQSNIVFANTSAIRIAAGSTNSASRFFTIADGTVASSTYGIDITPIVTNAPASSYFTDLETTTVFVQNLAPTVTKPVTRTDDQGPLSTYTNIAMGRAFGFDYIVKDVNADTSSMLVMWNFGDGTTLTVTGAVGTVYHTYSNRGTRHVTFQATDKDGASSDLIEFPVVVVSPPPDPTVSVIAPGYTLDETTDLRTGSFVVELSEAFTNIVTVNLVVSPTPSLVNGTILLTTNQVVFKAGEVDKTVTFSTRDGTDVSYLNGFDITPVVVGNVAASNYFKTLSSGNVTIKNVAPIISTPTTNDVSTITKGSPYVFSWDVKDVGNDLLATPVSSAMKVVWNFGDGNTAIGYGGSGSVSNTYTTSDDFTVTVTVTDKDGGSATRQFHATVKTAKEVMVTPIGPNFESSYYGATGLGYGMVSSGDAQSSVNLGNVYYFYYGPNAVSAKLQADPYKTRALGYYQVTNYSISGAASVSATHILKDSFFFTWVGTDQGIPEAKLEPSTTAANTAIALPESSSTSSSSGSTTTESVTIRDVEAIFSLEWRVADNMGDINQDGIPDQYAYRIEASGAVDKGDLPSGMTSLSGFNGDLDDDGNAAGDYLPINPTGANGVFDFRAVADGKGGNDFTAIYEVRGFHMGLNNAMYASDPDWSAEETAFNAGRTSNFETDEPGTDATLVDTDGDGFPDGWEYYFWYNAKFKGMTGSAYNPTNISQGLVIKSKVIYDAFVPNVASTVAANVRDLDGDGLTDLEELTIGTNPVNWDTDGDGICDTWEVMNGMNPCKSSDGLLESKDNPDGDYMAYASVSRKLVTVVQSGTTIITNKYLTADDTPSTNSSYTTWYHYGDDSAPIAVGRPVKLSANQTVASFVATNALILHFQVMNEFGFDPRTAWTGAINEGTHLKRFPTWLGDTTPNTKPFTSVDEYLLLKFMSENRLNGASDMMAANATVWQTYSTDPLTPDSDATKAKCDGMPDGWELYVSIAPGTDLSIAANRIMRISPWNPLDGDYDHPSTDLADGLINRREFAGTDSSAAYTNVSLYASAINSNFNGVVSITRPAIDANWLNKFWPSNPWAADTDGDGLNDLTEGAFIYGAPKDDGSKTCIQGGGLNPNSVDTDLDGLPDAWESQFKGTIPTDTTTTYTSMAVTNGMDGTFSDYAQDWDHDGLLNYQEYWVQAVRAFRYDIPDAGTTGILTGNAGLPMDTSFVPESLFSKVTNSWDRARLPWGASGATLYVMLPVGASKLYVSTDPTNPDTDYDGMDDYYELFHGLNPILGTGSRADGLDDRIARAYVKNGAFTIDCGLGLLGLGNDWGLGLPMDFVQYPWLAGMPEADPDADGLLNLEEALQPNTASPQNYNTDPSPLWMTDYSNGNSLTARFYGPMGALGTGLPMYFWPSVNFWPDYMFSFEQNEGFDTDNDGISDKSELIGAKNSLSDPQNTDDPVRRQAMWFSGLNSAAATLGSRSYGEWAFRNFTVELWARPEVTNTAQVLVERDFFYPSSDLSVTGSVIRCNFRIGIAADGRVYGMFQNAGSHDAATATVYAYGRTLATNEWAHITARMDGAASLFSLLINGQVYSTVATALVPANGVIIATGTTNTTEVTYRTGKIVVGATNSSTNGLLGMSWSSFGSFYRGYIDEVRIWDGARSNNEILSNYKKRFTRSDILGNRALVMTEVAQGYSRVPTNSLQLAAELVFQYTFDNLFSADTANHVATAPRGFMDGAVTINRPAFADVGWWSLLPSHSTVYTNYAYVPWIENTVGHQPVFGGVTYDSNGAIVLTMTNTVADSVYWTHTSAGIVSGLYNFPNTGNPYGFYYYYSGIPNDFEMEFASDLLPLGNAFAKQIDSMWDGQGASEVWTDTGADSDSDGLPDWWEYYISGSTTALNWDDVDPVTGMTYGELYQRAIAKGATESDPTGASGVKQTADTDGDGMPDWWEKIYGLDPQSAVGDDGALGDPDLDGLSNLAEYMISEVYGFRHLSPIKFKTSASQPVSDYYMKAGKMPLGEMFSDHDFMEDDWEDQYSASYVSRFVYDPMGDEDDDGWSNWAECRYRTYQDGTSPEVAMTTEVLDQMNYEFPIPTIEAAIRYNGSQSGGNIVLQVYHSSTMDGTPDAMFNVPLTSTTSSSSSSSTSSTTTKTQPIGYWANKTVKGRLSPGSILPGSVSYSFTDLWTDKSATTGFDINGILYYGTISGVYGAIGTINYQTGEFEIDLSHYANSWILLVDSVANIKTRNDYIICESSYLQMSYSVKAVDTWPKTVYLSRADTGYVREGTNYVFAFMDLNSSGAWDPGEPCGVTTPFATDIGWDYNRIAIQLKDYQAGYLRMSLKTGVRSEDVMSGVATATSSSSSSSSSSSDSTSTTKTRVRVRRTDYDNVATNFTGASKIILEKVLTSRTFLHEGDFMAQGDLATDWGLPVAVTSYARTKFMYEVSVADGTSLTNNGIAFTTVATFTNQFESTRAQAVCVSPISGKYVYSARPTFKWAMSDEYNAFAIQIYKGSSSGTLLYESGPLQAPTMDSDGEYVWQAPISAGDKMANGEIFSSNTLYAWRVIALNSKFTLTATPITWSGWGYFRLDVNKAPSSSGYGELRATVKYYGPATKYLSGRVKVQAFRTASFTGVPDAQCTLTDVGVGVMTNDYSVTTNVVLRGLLPSSSAGSYYLRAFIDQNTNGMRDAWESWGYANYYGVTITPYTPKPYTVTTSTSSDAATITIEDADTDQDWFPDAWEFEQNPDSADFLSLTGPNAGWSNTIGDTEVNTNLTTSATFTSSATFLSLVLATTDSDSDGIGDLAELLLGYSASSTASSSDGYSVSAKYSLGLAATDTLALRLTSINADSAGADVAWTVNVTKDSSVSRTLLSAATGISADSEVGYCVEYTASLVDPNWTLVASGTLTLDGTQTFESQIKQATTGIDLTQGFFRVRLCK